MRCKINKLDQVEAIRKECLTKSIFINGKDHPLTFIAEKMCKECLEKRISIFGRDHVDTISTVICLANFITSKVDMMNHLISI